MAMGRSKYSEEQQQRIREAAGLREGEPFFLIRAQDKLAGPAIDAYAGLLEAAGEGCAWAGDGSNLMACAADVNEWANVVRAWQTGTWTKLPD